MKNIIVSKIIAWCISGNVISSIIYFVNLEKSIIVRYDLDLS